PPSTSSGSSATSSAEPRGAAGAVTWRRGKRLPPCGRLSRHGGSLRLAAPPQSVDALVLDRDGAGAAPAAPVEREPDEGAEQHARRHSVDEEVGVARGEAHLRVGREQAREDERHEGTEHGPHHEEHTDLGRATYGRLLGVDRGLLGGVLGRAHPLIVAYPDGCRCYAGSSSFSSSSSSLKSNIESTTVQGTISTSRNPPATARSASVATQVSSSRVAPRTRVCTASARPGSGPDAIR